MIRSWLLVRGWRRLLGTPGGLGPDLGLRQAVRGDPHPPQQIQSARPDADPNEVLDQPIAQRETQLLILEVFRELLVRDALLDR